MRERGALGADIRPTVLKTREVHTTYGFDVLWNRWRVAAHAMFSATCCTPA